MTLFSYPPILTSQEHASVLLRPVASMPCSPVPIACLSLIQAAATGQQYRGRGKRVDCFLLRPGFLSLDVHGCLGVLYLELLFFIGTELVWHVTGT